MESEIEERLDDIFDISKLYINVYYKDIRLYEIVISVYNHLDVIRFTYKYDTHLTTDANIRVIENIINHKLATYFKY